MPDLPYSLARTPALDAWLRFNADGRVVAHTGKVELGQGIKTAVAAITAFELEIPIDQVEVVTANTVDVPNEGITAGSMSIQMTGAAVRQACAEVRALAFRRAADQFGVDVSNINLETGRLLPRGAGANAGLTYADLYAGGINADATGDAVPRQAVPAVAVARIDLPAKLAGEIAFVQDEVDGATLHARVVRHRTPGTPIESFDDTTSLALTGVTDVVRDGSFVAVLAESEAAAEHAARVLAANITWADEPPLAPASSLTLKSSVTHSLLIDSSGAPSEAPVPPPFESAHVVRSTYWKPYHLHGSIGPSAAVALWEADKLTIWSHAQGPFLLRGALAEALDIPPAAVAVHHRENAGCYGHNGADDAALDAALTARAVPGRRVLLKYTRADEHLNEPLSPATFIELSASVEADRITAWNADIYSETHSGRPAPGQQGSNLRAAWDLANPRARPPVQPGRGPHGGIHRNADPYYSFAQRRVVKHLAAPRVRTSSTRGLGAYANVFAIESFLDELALEMHIDAIALRQAHLDDPRARAVVERAGQAVARWRSAPRANTGCGMAFARYKNVQTYCAVAVLLEVDPDTADVHLLQAEIAADAGRVVDPDGLAHQLEGAFVQSASWTLKESVSFDAHGRTNTDWDSYPILRFSEVPRITTDVIDRPDQPSLGAGEAATGPTPAAIANAIFDASGIRARSVPMTPDALRAAAAV